MDIGDEENVKTLKKPIINFLERYFVKSENGNEKRELTYNFFTLPSIHISLTKMLKR